MNAISHRFRAKRVAALFSTSFFFIGAAASAQEDDFAAPEEAPVPETSAPDPVYEETAAPDPTPAPEPTYDANPDPVALSLEPTAAVDEGPETSFSVSLNQDPFFGFYPFAGGGVRVAPDLDVTFYSILWTTDLLALQAGEGAAGTLGLWTEFGAGVNFDLLDGNLAINPQIGILSGSLLSSGMSDRPKAFEGIVPNLTVNYADGLLEGELYAGYYKALRGESEARNDYLHYWLNAGVAPISWLSLGLHWEHLVHTSADEDKDIYQWIGGYLQFSAANASLRFIAGSDIVADDARDFYKVSVGMDF